MAPVVAVLLKSKTVWTGVAMIAAAASGVVQGTIEPGDALQSIGTGLIGIFLRRALAKGWGI